MSICDCCVVCSIQPCWMQPVALTSHAFEACLPAASCLQDARVHTQLKALIAQTTELRVQAPAGADIMFGSTDPRQKLQDESRRKHASVPSHVLTTQATTVLVYRHVDSSAAGIFPLCRHAELVAKLKQLPESQRRQSNVNSFCTANNQHQCPKTMQDCRRRHTCRSVHRRNMAASSTHLLAPRPETKFHLHPRLMLGRTRL